MLPAKLKPKGSHGRIKMEAMVRFVCERDGLTAKQQAALAAVKQGDMPRASFYRIYKTPGKKLLELGLVEVYEQEVRAQRSVATPKDTPYTLRCV